MPKLYMTARCQWSQKLVRIIRENGVDIEIIEAGILHPSKQPPYTPVIVDNHKKYYGKSAFDYVNQRLAPAEEEVEAVGDGLVGMPMYLATLDDKPVRMYELSSHEMHNLPSAPEDLNAPKLSVSPDQIQQLRERSLPNITKGTTRV